MISLGGCRFRYEVAALTEEAGMAVINGEADLDQALDREVLPFGINDTSQPRLVVLTPRRTWEVPLHDVDLLSIGRTAANQLTLEHPQVSRYHAEVQHRAGAYVLRDLDSPNGTW